MNRSVNWVPGITTRRSLVLPLTSKIPQIHWFLVTETLRSIAQDVVSVTFMLYTTTVEYSEIGKGEILVFVNPQFISYWLMASVRHINQIIKFPLSKSYVQFLELPWVLYYAMQFKSFYFIFLYHLWFYISVWILGIFIVLPFYLPFLFLFEWNLFSYFFFPIQFYIVPTAKKLMLLRI